MVTQEDDVIPVDREVSFLGIGAGRDYVYYKQTEIVPVGTQMESFSSMGKPIEVKLFPSSRSTTHNYEGPALVPLFEETETGPALVATFRILPNHAERVLVFLFPNPKYSEEDRSTLKYVAYVMSDSAKDVPYGKMRFFNLTRNEYDVWMSGDVIKVPRGLSQIYGDSSPAKYDLKFLLKREQTYKFLFNMTVRIDRNARYLLLLIPAPDPNSLKIYPKLLIEVSDGGAYDSDEYLEE